MLTETYEEYYKRLKELVTDLELTDLDDYDGELPEAGVRSFYERGLTTEQAAYEIQTEGI